MTPPWLMAPLERLDAIFDRLPHGLLIQGPGGWGEETVAAALVERLLRLESAQEPRDVAHPDLRWVEPEAGIIRVDQMRATIEFLHQTPRFAGRKVAVIVAADRMNQNAANALLKSLEEPPDNSFAVLVSGAPERLLPTVCSRCQRLEVHPASDDVVMAWLGEAGVEEERARHLVIEYGAAPFTVLEAVERDEEPLMSALVEAARQPAKAVEVAERRREDSLADLTARWLRIVHWWTRQHLDQPGSLMRGASPSRSPAEGSHMRGASPSRSPAEGSLLDFAAELQQLRGMALANTGLNRAMQLQRLFLMWAELWRETGFPPKV